MESIEFAPDFDLPDVIQTDFQIIGDASALFTALASAQSKFKAIPETKTVTVSTRQGRSYSYQYADLSSIIDIVRPALNREKIYLSQTVSKGRVQTILAGHDAVLVFSTQFANNDISPQEQGSVLTYYKRYSLSAALGVASGGEDVDADDTVDGDSKIVPIMSKPQKFKKKDYAWWTAWQNNILAELEAMKPDEVQQYVVAIQKDLSELKEFDAMLHSEVVQQINAAKKETGNG